MNKVTEKDLNLSETLLNAPDPEERLNAIARLGSAIEEGQVERPASRPLVNLHTHTVYSYNPYEYTPSLYAWLSLNAGLEVAGIVDFDVLDGLDEFYWAGRNLDLKTCVNLETRVYVPEFSTRELGSPGEPGITYHMGVGFCTTDLNDEPAVFLQALRTGSEQRNRELLERVNVYTDPVTLDYDKDVLPLTPKGNATERHVCQAFAQKAREHFPDEKTLAVYWSEKLEAEPDALGLPDSGDLQAAIRAKTMKKGGVGYVQPGEGSFPCLEDMNRFVFQSGAIPTAAWLNGLSDGEQAMEEFLTMSMRSGVAALNIIPDRNFTAGVKDQKLANLYEVVELANRLHLPIIVGTEMNSPGQKFVDDFDSEELSPLVPVFLKGAHIFYAHTVLQRAGGMGLVSDWANSSFTNVEERNEFFRDLGYRCRPSKENKLEGIDGSMNPNEVFDRLGLR